MNSNENISKQQMIYITANFTIGASLIILTGIKYARKDSFICDILGLILGVLVALMMAYIVDQFPNMEYTQILDKIFNPTIGRVVAVMYLIFSVSLLALIESDISGLITTIVMTKTPSWVILLSIIAISAYILNKGIEIFSLNVEILFPLSFILIGFIYILLIFKFGDLSNLLPIFSEDPKDILRGTIDVFAFPYLDNCILIFIYSLSKEKLKKSKVVKTSYLMISFFLIIRSVVVISVLGIDEVLRFTFPFFEAVRLIQIGSYIERLELLLLIAWIINAYIKLTICYYVILKCIQYIFNLKDYKKLSTALIVFVIPIGINAVSSTDDLFIDNSVTTPSIKIPILVITILVFIKALILSRKKVNAE